MTNKSSRHLLVSIASTISRQLGVGVLGLMTQILVARIYGAEGNGFIAVALLLPTTLSTLLNMGLASANIYYVASAQASLYRAWQVTQWLGTLISLLGLVLGGLIIVYLPEWFSGVPQRMLWLALASFPPLLFINLISGLFQATQNFRLFNLLGLLQPAVLLVCLLVLCVLHVADPLWVVIAQLIAALAVLAIARVWLVMPADSACRLRPLSYFKLAMSYGAKAHLSNIIAFLNYKSDIFLVNFFLGPALAGVYVVAVNIAERLWIVSQATSTVVLPRLAELSAEAERRDQLTPLLCRFVLIITLFVSTAVALSVPLVVPALFGLQFVASVQPLLYLLPGIVFGSASRVLANDVAARGRPELNMVSSVAVFVFNLLANLLLIPKLGLSGAAIATSCSYFLNLVLKVWQQRQLTGMPVLLSFLPQRGDLALLSQRFRVFVG